MLICIFGENVRTLVIFYLVTNAKKKNEITFVKNGFCVKFSIFPKFCLINFVFSIFLKTFWNFTYDFSKVY